MATDPAAKAKAHVDQVVAGLERPTELAAITARAMVDAAQAAARGRPTPQAPMVSAGFTVDNQTIRGPRAGTLAELVMGSDYGSTRYRQFGSRHGGGSWLRPTLDTPPAGVEAAQTDWLRDLLNG